MKTSEELDYFVKVLSPSGEVFIAFNSYGICHLVHNISIDNSPAKFAVLHQKRFGRKVQQVQQVPEAIEKASKKVKPNLVNFDLRNLSEFRQAVLQKTLEIPWGQVRSYGWIAQQINRPKASRAVGSALANNPIPILIPCHRVVRGDGKIGEYVLGPNMKQQLLKMENFQ